MSRRRRRSLPLLTALALLVALTAAPAAHAQSAATSTAATSTAAGWAAAGWAAAGSAAADSAPAGSTAADSAPASSTAAGSTSVDSAATVSAPAGSAATISSSAGSISAGLSPAGSAPAGLSPAGSVPAGSIPADLVPAGSVPAASAPAASASAASASAAIPRLGQLSQNVHLFYYPWYGAANGTYRHWQQGGHTPPDDIGANLYPKAGPYDSGDFAGVVDQHMRWVVQSGAGVLVYSWWGQGSYEDSLAQGTLDAAARYGIKVAWHLEPYNGRSAASTVADINYINQRYGSHPAFYRSAEHGNKAAFYVFQSLFIPDADWAALDAVTGENIVLAQTTNPARTAHFSGMYTYDAIAGATAPGWEEAGEYAAANGLIWSPSVGPGYNDDRAVPGNTTPTLDRANGATYDQEWTNALDPAKGGVPTWVSVTSFNEWHEGSVIEPASSTPPSGFGYQTYEGAYGRTGPAAETAYLDRTAHWTTEFEQRRAGTQPTNLALNRPTTADGRCAPTEGSEKAVNGSVSGGNSDKWCSLGARPWLRVDLGAQRQVGRVVLRHAGAGGETPAFNTRDYDVQTSPDGATWTTLVAARANTQNVTAHVVAPVTARYIRLTVLTPTQNQDKAARIYELEAYAR